MIVLRTADDMRAWSRAQRAEGRSIGFVPTMGALHDGHVSLMAASVAECDISVASIFVNPTQFAPGEDLDQYPRTWDEDLAQCEAVGIDAIYAPKASDMYAADYSTYVVEELVATGLESVTRPHFFRGVCTVVCKLFNAVDADRAYFGQKDAQQCAVIKRMVRDLDLGIEIVEMPIVREADGLAMSSRNVYLSESEHASALCLSQGLEGAEALMAAGERNAEVLRERVASNLENGAKLDYVAVVDADSMQPVETVAGTVCVAVAAFVGETRLIDNVKFVP